jgi:hypothetical protein
MPFEYPKDHDLQDMDSSQQSLLQLELSSDVQRHMQPFEVLTTALLMHKQQHLDLAVEMQAHALQALDQQDVLDTV